MYFTLRMGKQTRVSYKIPRGQVRTTRFKKKVTRKKKKGKEEKTGFTLWFSYSVVSYNRLKKTVVERDLYLRDRTEGNGGRRT